MSERLINRRKLLKTTGAGGAVATVGLSGCLGQDENDQTDSSNIGGELIVGLAASPQTFNPFRIQTSEAWAIVQWMYSGLVQLDGELDPYGDLATDWESSDSASTWTFYLREDAIYHHNSENVTSEDVKASLTEAAQEDSTAHGRGAEYIESVEVNGDYEITVNLVGPNADFPKMIARPWGRILPKESIENDFEELSENDVGSGPFILEEYQIDDGGTLVRNEDYYKEDDNGNTLPYLDEVTFTIIPEASSRVTALTNGDVDIINQFPETAISRVENSEGVSVRSTGGGRFHPIVMNTNVEPFDNPDLRDAIKFAMDNAGILAAARNDLGDIGQHHPICPVHEFHTELTEVYGREARPDEAEQSLEAAGYGDGITIDQPLRVPADRAPALRPYSELFHSQCQQVGIDFEIQNVNWSTFLDEVEGNADWYISTYSLRPLEESILRVFLTEDGAFYGNQWHESQPDIYNEFVEEIDMGVSTADSDERATHYSNAMELIRNHAGIAVPFFQDQLDGIADHVEGFEQSPVGQNILITETKINK